MKKTRLTLHIGLPKTGTTTIQKTLGSNEQNLAQLGIVYPEFGQRHGAHHLLADPFVQQKNLIRPEPGLSPETLTAGIFAYAEEGQHVILSSEAFASATKLRPPLKQLAEKFDLHIVVFFREQTEYADSLARQMLRMQLFRPDITTARVLDKGKPPRSYVEIARLWRDELPEARVSIVTLSPRDDSWKLFADIVEPELNAVSLNQPPSNISLNIEALAFLHWFSSTARARSPEENNRISNILEDYSRQKRTQDGQPRHSVLPAALLEKIRRDAEAINLTLANEFCDGVINFGPPPEFESIDIRDVPADAILEVADYVFDRYDRHISFLRGKRAHVAS